MAKIQVKKSSDKNAWYPRFITTITMTKEEHAKLPQCFQQAKTLKNGTVKFRSSGMVLDSNATVESRYQHYVKMMDHFGLEIEESI